MQTTTSKLDISKSSAKWQKMRLGDVIDINSRSIGANFRHKHITYIDISSVGTGELLEASSLDLSTAPGRAKRLVSDGDTILSTVRPNRRSFLFIKNPTENTVVSTGFAVLSPKSSIDSRFLYYLVTRQQFTDYLESNTSGSAYPVVSPETIADAKVVIPPLPEQHNIASILGCLDDKIGLNRQMNETLEGIAQALFKSWFVDFDPVRAKIEGQDIGLPKEIAELFPDSFEDSEMGEIPRGWGVGKFNDVAELIRDQLNPFNFPDELFAHFSLPAFDHGQWPRMEMGETIKSGKFVVPSDSILLSKLNPEVERVWLVDVQQKQRSICSTEFLVLKAKYPFNRAYLYCLARSAYLRQKLQSMVTGTSKSHQRAQPTAVLTIPILMPPQAILAMFAKQSESLLKRSLVCRDEVQTLSVLRDTLLPELLSGAIPVHP